MSNGTERPEAKDIPDAVLWHEGMLLGPQHFQLAARRVDQLVAYMAAASLPYRWGLRQLAIKSSRLSEGSFEIESLEGVMPDGLIVCYPLDGAEPLALELAPYSDVLKQGSATVFLAVLAQRIGLRVDPDTNLGRYAHHSLLGVKDDQAEDGASDVASLRPALRLILEPDGREPPLKFVCLPLAKIGLDEGRIVEQAYAPPHLVVDRHSPLHRLIEDLVATLRNKAVTRVEYLKASGIGGFSAEATQLRALVAPLPRLEALIDHGTVHPFDLYLALADTLGALACLGSLAVPEKLPDYRHADPLPSFRIMIDRINRLVDQLEERFDKYVFDYTERGSFALELKEEWLAPYIYVQFFARTSQPLWVIEQWAKRALIGERQRMGQIREARALGAARTLIERAEEIDLVRTGDAVLVRIPLRSSTELNGLQLSESRILEIEGEIPHDPANGPEKIILYVTKAPEQSV